MKNTDMLIRHYDALIDEGNDPVLDPSELKAYMDRWDGEAFLSLLALTGTEDVLEIGVGTGRLAVRTAPDAASFTGIDLSPKTLSRAAEHLAPFEPTLLCGDFLTYAFGNTYDVIYSSLTFLHIEDKAAAYRKAASLLKPGGRFVLSMDQDESGVIDMGTRIIRTYPEPPERTEAGLSAAGLTVTARIETEAAVLFAAISENNQR